MTPTSLPHSDSPTRRTVIATALAAGAALGGSALLGSSNALRRVACADDIPAPTPRRMPCGFIGHGSPMMAVDSEAAAPWRAWGESLGRPAAILVVSAHFERAPITIGASRRVPLIYDFSGFPRELYRMQYPAPGAPELAARAEALLRPLGDVRRDDRRGHDHGTWVPMRWMRPAADVPMLSISLPTHDPRRLVQMGRALRPLRDEGVFVLGSGSLTHNLRRMAENRRAVPFGWATAFDEWANAAVVRNDLDALIDWQSKAPDARLNHPTVEHFVPLLLAIGARHATDRVRITDHGIEYGGLSRRSFSFEPA